MSNLNQGVLPAPTVEAAGMLSVFLDLIQAATTTKGRKEIEGTVAKMLKASEANKAMIAEAQAIRLDAEKLAELTAGRERDLLTRTAELDAREESLNAIAANQSEISGQQATTAQILKDREKQIAATEKELDGMRVSLAAEKNMETV